MNGEEEQYNLRHLHIHREEKLQDSLELGTGAKGGGIKIYFNAKDPADAEIRILNAIRLKKIGVDALEGLEPEDTFQAEPKILAEVLND